MRQVLLAFCVGLALLFSDAMAAGRSDKARLLVEKAAESLKVNGPEKTFAAINDPKGPFRDGDFYVFVHDRTGLIHAHGGFPSYIGSNTIWARDRNGKEFVREIVSVQTDRWIVYDWLNPVSMITEQKTVYVLRVGDFLICSGAYSKSTPED